MRKVAHKEHCDIVLLLLLSCESCDTALIPLSCMGTMTRLREVLRRE
jgi:hypothetical protein